MQFGVFWKYLSWHTFHVLVYGSWVGGCIMVVFLRSMTRMFYCMIGCIMVVSLRSTRGYLSGFLFLCFLLLLLTCNVLPQSPLTVPFLAWQSNSCMLVYWWSKSPLVSFKMDHIMGLRARLNWYFPALGLNFAFVWFRNPLAKLALWLWILDQ